MQLVLERRAERSTLIAVASPLIAFALTIVTPAEESLTHGRPSTADERTACACLARLVLISEIEEACGGAPAKFSPA